MGSSAVAAHEYWGYLINPDKSPTPVFEQLLLGVANYIVLLSGALVRLLKGRLTKLRNGRTDMLHHGTSIASHRPSSQRFTAWSVVTTTPSSSIPKTHHSPSSTNLWVASTACNPRTIPILHREYQLLHPKDSCDGRRFSYSSNQESTFRSYKMRSSDSIS